MQARAAASAEEGPERTALLERLSKLEHVVQQEQQSSLKALSLILQNASSA